MADKVTNKRNELVINSVRYPLVGEVVRSLTSEFAEKQVIGGYDTNSMKRLDTWEVPLYPGYVGVQEANLAKESHQGRSWWTDLITEQDGYTTLPRLATALSGNGDGWAIPTGCAGDDVAFNWSNESNAIDGDTTTDATCAAIAVNDIWTDTLKFTWSGDITCDSVRYYTDVDPTKYDVLKIELYYGGQYNTVYSGVPTQSSWTTVAIGSTEDVSYGRISFQHNGTSSDAASVAELNLGVLTPQTDYSAATAFHFVNFNGELYMSADSTLYKLDSNRLFHVAKTFDATITSLLVGTSGNLLIFLGDSTNYYYMTSVEALTQTNVNDANLGITWDGKMWKMDTDGNWWYSTNGDSSATPTWSAGGALADIPDQVESLFRGYDADGNDQIYCATNSILKVYDDTNAKWTDTQVKLPDHPNGGKGAAYWSGGHYISYGLGVRKYEPIEYRDDEVGLTKDDGIPSEYNGEIVKFGAEAASNVLYALIDASQVTGTQKSGLWVYDGVAWRCWWADTANDRAMHDIIVSSAESGYAVYWDCGGAIYYINLQRGIQNPRQLVGTITFAASGKYVSPNFDAYWAVGNKIAVQVRCSVRGDVSADETVTVKYRTNHSNETIASGWTTLGSAITSAGETTLPMPTSAAPAGTSFRSIQLGLDLVRKAADTDETPVVVYLALDYYKVIPKSWGWAATLDLSKVSYADKSSEQLIDALITAAETESLVTLVYEDSTKYVRVEDVQISHTTGEYPKGTAKVFLTEI